MRKAISHAGFTLLELLVVVAIIGLLASIASPMYSEHIKKATEARVESDLRSVATAQYAHFADTENYITCLNESCPALLAGIQSLSPGVTLSVTSSETGFTAEASHPNINTICRWDTSAYGFDGCT